MIDAGFCVLEFGIVGHLVKLLKFGTCILAIARDDQDAIDAVYTLHLSRTGNTSNYYLPVNCGQHENEATAIELISSDCETA